MAMAEYVDPFMSKQGKEGLGSANERAAAGNLFGGRQARLVLCHQGTMQTTGTTGSDGYIQKTLDYIAIAGKSCKNTWYGVRVLTGLERFYMKLGFFIIVFSLHRRRCEH